MKLFSFFLTISILSVVVLTSCKSVEEVPTGNQMVDFTEIKSAHLYINEEQDFSQGGFITNSEEAFLTVLGRMNSDQTIVDANAINFEEHMVLTYFDKVRGTAGHTLKVKLIEETEALITVHVQHTGPKEMAAEVITQPFVMVSTLKSTKEVRFVFTE